MVLISGVSRFPGCRLAAQLAADPSLGRVIGVDTASPESADLARLGRTEFVRADIRNPLIGSVLAAAGVDVVVHTCQPGGPRRGASGGIAGGPSVGRSIGRELDLPGTRQLLAAARRAETLRRFVLVSSTAVYGAGPRDPAAFAEDDVATVPLNGAAADLVAAEAAVRGFARRRADVVVSVLRLAELIGPTVDSRLCRYLRLPVVPTVLGFDPRLQLLHEDDAVEALRLASVSDRPGVVNVAADEVVTLTQAIRRAGRRRMPLLAPLAAPLGGIGEAVPNRLVRGAGGELASEHGGYLRYGRVVDTTRLHEEFGFHPSYTTGEALASFVAVTRSGGIGPRQGGPAPEGARNGLRRGVAGLLRRIPGASLRWPGEVT